MDLFLYLVIDLHEVINITFQPAPLSSLLVVCSRRLVIVILSGRLFFYCDNNNQGTPDLRLAFLSVAQRTYFNDIKNVLQVAH